MAGDWLKMEIATPDKPEVLAITASLGWDDPDLTVGKLFRIWRWFDQHTTNGNAAGVTSALLDRISGVTGFAQAMANVGWLCIDSAGISLPNFDYHNGETAKQRALTAKRVAKHKSNAKGNAEGNAKGNASSVTGALPREEKRREEKKQSKTTTTTPDCELFAGIDPQVVSDFKAMRTKQRAAITQTAIDGIQREAAKAGLALEDALRICCERNWRGFKAEWLQQQSRAAPAYQDKNDKRKAWMDELTGANREQHQTIIDIN